MAGPEPQHAAQEAVEHKLSSEHANADCISVSDKTGIVELARALHALGVRCISTGGTAKLLAEQACR
jgi:hypothetical protein